MSKFAITIRSISGDQFGGGVGQARYLIVRHGVQPAPSHTVSPGVWLKAVLATFAKTATGALQGEALFLIHGYNVASADADTWRDAVALGLAQHGGGYAPTLISFDWPSAGTPFAYLPDLDVAAKTAIDLVNYAVRPLLKAQTANCQVRVNALAHSMGAFVPFAPRSAMPTTATRRVRTGCSGSSSWSRATSKPRASRGATKTPKA